MSRTFAFTAAAYGGLSLALLSAPASAQCFKPDQLTGPCWDPVQVNLPQFPFIPGIGTLGICWDTCSPTQQEPLFASVLPPLPGNACGDFTSQITVGNET